MGRETDFASGKTDGQSGRRCSVLQSEEKAIFE